jgi:hypothetical protein
MMYSENHARGSEVFVGGLPRTVTESTIHQVSFSQIALNFFLISFFTSQFLEDESNLISNSLAYMN